MNDVKKCPHCGKQVHNSAQYCMFCMHSLVPKQDITPRIYSTGKKTFAGILLLGVVLLLLGLIAGGIFYLKSPRTPSEKDTNLQQNSTKLPVTQTDGQPVAAPEPSYSVPTAEDTQPVSSSNPTVPSTPVENDPGTVDTPTVDTPTVDTPTVDTPTVQQPTCTHSYAAASCVAPATCITCGDTIGSADPSAHNWKPEYAPIHHDQVGHYETQEVQYQKTIYLCFFCGYNQDGYDTLEDLRTHIAVHANAPDYAFVISRPDMLAETRQVWASKYEQVWVVDKEAYDEMHLVGYTCTLCGSIKEAQ